MPKEKEGKVVDNARVEAEDARDVNSKDVNSREVVLEDGTVLDVVPGTDGATLVSPEPVILAPELSEAALDQGPTEVNPEKGLVPDSQIPVFTPGVYAPASSVILPNAQRDAQLILAKLDPDDDGAPGKRSVRLDMDSDAPRDARDLAILLRQYPHFINELSRLEEVEKGEGVPNPDPWVANPVDLLEEAKRYNMFFINASGNFVPRPDGM